MLCASFSYFLLRISWPALPTTDSSHVIPSLIPQSIYITSAPTIVTSFFVVDIAVLVSVLAVWQLKRFKRGGDLEYFWFSLANQDAVVGICPSTTSQTQKSIFEKDGIEM